MHSNSTSRIDEWLQWIQHAIIAAVVAGITTAIVGIILIFFAFRTELANTTRSWIIIRIFLAIVFVMVFALVLRNRYKR